MNEERRPDPEVLLARIKEEERLQSKGKLKIFFGAAPGVGKTYGMLQEALEKKAEGIDIVAGIVETHGRKEVESMLSKLEQVPRRIIEYRQHMLYEMDLDKILERKPKIVLIDELAHTNIPESRHAKRWQDIKELLECEIDVYTTLNVQHLESLNDVIAQITGVTVRETVPDSILEEADAVELIDLPPDDLLKRLQEGKVYAPKQAELASQKFFNKGNLIALRELALRMTAERVNAQALTYRESQAIQKSWPTTERLLVCITPSVRSSKLIRAAKRMAARLQAEWLVVYIETTKKPKLSEVERHHLLNHFRLAESLGGKTFTLTGRHVVEELIHFARDHNVTKIVVDKSMHTGFGLFSDPLNELIRNSGTIDIYLIQGGYEKNYRFLPIIHFKPVSKWQSYLISVGMVVLCTLIGFFLSPFFDLNNLVMVYLLGVILIAVQGRYGPAVLASLLSILALDFFFVSPHVSFIIEDTQYLISLIVMLLMALIITRLVNVSRWQANISRLRERRTSAMYALSRQLASSRGVDKIIKVAVRHVSEVFDGHASILLPNANDQLQVMAYYGKELELNEKEMGIVHWVYEFGQVAGLGTQTLPVSKSVYIPLLGANHIVGVLRVFPVDAHRLVIPEQMHLLETFASQIALSIEVDQLSVETK